MNELLNFSTDQVNGAGEEARPVTRQRRFTCDATLSENKSQKSRYF